MQENFLESTLKQFKYYQQLGDKSFAQLSEQELFYKPLKSTTSIANVVYHLRGNMLSRWTNFLTEDGEKEWRKREEEFEDILTTKEEVLNAWEEGWTCLFDALNEINAENFNHLVYIRNQGHSIIEAVLRQMAHYAYHVGQIVWIAKSIRGDNWDSLSIPKGASMQYNEEKFAQSKSRAHFTDEFLKRNKTKHDS